MTDTTYVAFLAAISLSTHDSREMLVLDLEAVSLVPVYHTVDDEYGSRGCITSTSGVRYRERKRQPNFSFLFCCFFSSLFLYSFPLSLSLLWSPSVYISVRLSVRFSFSIISVVCFCSFLFLFNNGMYAHKVKGKSGRF